MTFGGAVAATAAPAQAREYRHYGGYDNRYYGRHRGNDTGVAIAAGVAGLALGAALASNGNGYSRGDASRGSSSGYYAGG